MTSERSEKKDSLLKVSALNQVKSLKKKKKSYTDTLFQLF